MCLSPSCAPQTNEERVDPRMGSQQPWATHGVMAQKRDGTRWRLPQQRRGLRCGIRGKTSGSNPIARSEWQDARPGGSDDSVNDPNVPVSFTTTCPNVLGGLSNGPNFVRDGVNQ